MLSRSSTAERARHETSNLVAWWALTEVTPVAALVRAVPAAADDNARLLEAFGWATTVAWLLAGIHLLVRGRHENRLDRQLIVTTVLLWWAIVGTSVLVPLGFAYPVIPAYGAVAVGLLIVAQRLSANGRLGLTAISSTAAIAWLLAPDLIYALNQPSYDRGTYVFIAAGLVGAWVLAVFPKRSTAPTTIAT